MEVVVASRCLTKENFLKAWCQYDNVFQYNMLQWQKFNFSGEFLTDLGPDQFLHAEEG